MKLEEASDKDTRLLSGCMFEGSQLSLITRKPVFWVCDQVRLKLAYAATEAS